MVIFLYFIIALIALIAGYFIGKNSLAIKVKNLEETIEDLKYKIDLVNAKNKTLMATFKNQGSGKNNSQVSLNPVHFDKGIRIKELVIKEPDEIKKLYGKIVINNDFKIIEGIGPKLEKLLNQSDIVTWIDLANTSANTLKDFLKNYGNRYTLHDPSTWPMQAELAALGKWKELKNYQSKLHKGKEILSEKR